MSTRRLEGVKFLWHAQPTRILGGEAVEGLELTRLAASEDGSIIPNLARSFAWRRIWLSWPSGRVPTPAFFQSKVQLERGRIVIDRATGQTSDPKYFAGGDCTNGGREVVDAVADGKRAGIGIAAWLEATPCQA